MDNMKKTLANVFELYFIAQGLHWNVTGINFIQYHEFFGNMYKEIHDSIDTLAEHIRSTNTFVEYGCESICKYSTVSTTNIYGSDIKSMIDSLSLANQIVIYSYEELLKDTVNEGIRNFISTRLEVHNKYKYMLDSINAA